MKQLFEKGLAWASGLQTDVGDKMEHNCKPSSLRHRRAASRQKRNSGFTIIDFFERTYGVDSVRTSCWSLCFDEENPIIRQSVFV
jgi:hypothetical protein